MRQSANMMLQYSLLKLQAIKLIVASGIDRKGFAQSENHTLRLWCEKIIKYVK